MGQQHSSMAVFRPPYVGQGFQQHYTSTTLAHVDRISLPADILIWAAGLLSTWHTPLGTLCAAPPLAFAVGCTLWRHTCHEGYLRHRTAITAMRRLTIYPYLTLVYLAQRPPQAAATASPLAAFVHLFVLSGSFVVCAAALMLNYWWTALWEVPVSVAAFAATAPISCRDILAGPQPYAGWRAAAELMDATALNIYSSSLQDSALEHAVCCTTLNTMLVGLGGFAASLAATFLVSDGQWWASRSLNAAIECTCWPGQCCWQAKGRR